MIPFAKKNIFLLFFLIACTLLPIVGQGTVEPTFPKLSVWDFKFNDPRTQRVFTKIDNLFRQQQSNVELIHVGYDEENYIPALRAALLANNAPDIIFLHHGAEFNEFQSYLLPLAEFMDQSSIDFRPLALQEGVSDHGIQKAIPLTMQGMGWYYNKELFQKAGLDPDNPPQSWDDFLQACELLQQHGITPIAMGNNRPLTTDFIRRSLISAFFDDDEIENFFHKGQGIRDDRFLKIIDFNLHLAEKNYLDPSGTFRPYFNYAGDSFSQGKTAMTMGLLSDIANWHEFSHALGFENIGYFPNLIHPDMNRPGVQLLQEAGVLIGINKDSKHKELAYAYLNSLFSPASQRLLVDELGMLLPVGNPQLPVEKYPVLRSIEQALQYTGADLERYTGSLFIRDFVYRYDSLLFNTREISLQDYIMILYTKLQLF
jgi:ABC-type glycerol-3-phosphate transport system substrate-binding protein